MPDELIEKALTEVVIGMFFEVYNNLGYGFLEHVYLSAMDRELRSRGHLVERERLTQVYYKGEELCLYRIDMVIDRKLVIEAKSTERLHPSTTRQLYNYLKATEFEIGLVLHFGPEPKFFRQICTRKPRSSVPDRLAPPNVINLS